MYTVTVYDVFLNKHSWEVPTLEKAREYAKRIATEGLWFIEGPNQVFYPVHQIVKVVISPEE